jgi:hypothetical protein
MQAPSRDQPVFVADHPWRGRAVKAAIAAAALLLLGWLVAIVIGALGFGSLPGIPFAEGDGNGGSASSAPGHPTAGSAPPGPASPSAVNRGAAGAGTTAAGGAGAQGAAGQSPAGSPSAAAPSPSAPAPTAIPGSGHSNGQGRGAPTTQPQGGRGAPEVNPSGRDPGANAKGSNPNAGGANASAIGYQPKG